MTEPVKAHPHTQYLEMEFIDKLGRFASGDHVRDKEKLLRGYLAGLEKRHNMCGMNKTELRLHAEMALRG